MKTRISLRGAILTLVIFTFTLALTTCGGGSHRVAQGFSPGSSSVGSGGFQAAEGVGSLEAAPPDIISPQSVDEALAELDALEAPDGVDEALFAELKDALASQLESRLSSRDSSNTASRLENRDSRDGGKFTSVPPTGEANRVTDLELIDNGGTYTLTWSYRNLGDCGQDGSVGIEDVTPLAMHFGETYAPTDVNCLLAVIDGSGSHAIDISDVTPIAMNFGVDCAGYRIQRGDSLDGAFSSFREVAFADATGDGRLSFSTELLSVTQPYLRVVPFDAEGVAGQPSDPVFIYIPGDPPEITSVSPTSGVEGESVEFSAGVNGTAPFDYSWDFGGGAAPNTPMTARPTVTLGAAGEYDEASLTVSNDFGEDTYPFTLTVTEETTYSVSGHVEKDTGGGLQGVALTLTPGNYPATTNSSGDYTITDVPNGNYTLTPVLADWSFEPLTHSVTVNNGNVSGKDFTATTGGGDDCTVLGHVEKDTGGGLQGVSLTLTPGEYSGITNASGNFTITGVPAGEYTLTPNLAGWSFDPPSRIIEAIPSGMTPYLFTATSDI